MHTWGKILHWEPVDNEMRIQFSGYNQLVIREKYILMLLAFFLMLYAV